VHKIKLSQVYSLILTADHDGEIILWDLNRLRSMRRILPTQLRGKSIIDVAVNNISGEICICTNTSIFLCSINGELLASVDTSSVLSGSSSLAKTERDISALALSEGPEWMSNNLIFTGHRNGSLGIWRVNYDSTQWAIELVKFLVVDGAKLSKITCIAKST
jgi:hypothetical protein